MAMVQSTNDHDQLSGVRVLVVEDDALLAMDLEATLVEAGAVVVGLCQTLDEAMARADADDFAVAVLDFGLGSETVSPVARRLVNRGVPFILYTGKSRHEPSLAEWRDCLDRREASLAARAGVRRKNCSVALILARNVASREGGVIRRAEPCARPARRMFRPGPKAQPASSGRGSAGS